MLLQSAHWRTGEPRLGLLSNVARECWPASVTCWLVRRFVKTKLWISLAQRAEPKLGIEKSVGLCLVIFLERIVLEESGEFLLENSIMMHSPQLVLLCLAQQFLEYFLRLLLAETLALLLQFLVVVDGLALSWQQICCFLCRPFNHRRPWLYSVKRLDCLVVIHWLSGRTVDVWVVDHIGVGLNLELADVGCLYLLIRISLPHFAHWVDWFVVNIQVRNDLLQINWNVLRLFSWLLVQKGFLHGSLKVLKIK